MFCRTCGRMYFACYCAGKPTATPPPPVSLTHAGYGLIGTVNPATGIISAPGQSYNGLQVQPLGQIPGTNLVIGPGGMIK